MGRWEKGVVEERIWKNTKKRRSLASGRRRGWNQETS